MSEDKTCLVGKPSQIYCEVCNVYISSASLLATHIKGKKHQSLQKVQEAQSKAAALSVYITGIKCSETNEDEMSAFFSSFGKVKKVYFDKNKGVYAIVEFEDEKSVSEILGNEEPIVFKGKHLRIKKRTFAKQKAPEKQETRKSPEANPKKRKKRHSSESKTTFLPKEIIDKLKQQNTVSKQIDLLMSELRLTEEDMQLRSLVCKVLEEVFKEFSPSVEVIPYGSSANGLGCKGTDLDITILTDKDILDAELDTDESGEPEAMGSKVYTFVVKVLRNLVPGCSHVIPIYSAKCPVIKFTHESSGLSCDLTINNRLGIQNTKLLSCYMALDPRVAQLVYIIRAWAKALGISGGNSGQLTSYALTLMVIYFLETTNPPVIPSLQNISEWPMNAKMRSGDENDKVNNVKDCYIDEWDCSFFEDVTMLSPSLNIKHVEKLLEGFFDFYGNKFDYGNCAVNIRKAEKCTTLSIEDELREIEMKRKKFEVSETSTVPGMTLETEMAENKGDLEHKSNLGNASEESKPKEIGTTWKTTPICVQDPFELTHNVTQNVGVPSLRNIIHCMMNGFQVCSTFPSDGHLTESDGIASFFSNPTKTPTKRKKREGYSFSVYLCDKSKMDEAIPAGGIVCIRHSTPEELFDGFCKYLKHDLQMRCDLEGDCSEQDLRHFGATFTATTNTWMHSRRERRKSKGKDDFLAASGEEKSCSVSSESSLVQDSDTKTLEQAAEVKAVPVHQEEDKNKPLLVFKLILSEKKSSSGGKSGECVVKLEHADGTGLQTFENFYAFFKKQMQAFLT